MIGFQNFSLDWAREAYRVLKPGAHLVAFGGSRTYHRLACAIEDAGFEIRDCVMWVYGSGFPKSHDVSKAIDRAAGAEREIIGRNRYDAKRSGTDLGRMNDDGWQPGIRLDTAPATAAAAQWEGFGTALKPAVEPIVLARKPLSEPTVAANVLRWGTGAINVDGCRVESEGGRPRVGEASQERRYTHNGNTNFAATPGPRGGDPAGRWPANLVHDGSEEVVAAFPSTDGANGGGRRLTRSDWRGGGDADKSTPHSFGDSGSAARFFASFPQDGPKGRWPANLVHDGSEEVVAAFPDLGKSTGGRIGNAGGGNVQNIPIGKFSKGDPGFGDSGSAARFFYTAKADADERLGSRHPTVKPVDLMQWLVRLVTPPGGRVVDPFAGTGTTGEAAWREGFSAVLIEAEADSCADIRRRMALALAGPVERAHATVKARGQVDHDPGPLFAGVNGGTPPPPSPAWTEMWERPFDYAAHETALAQQGVNESDEAAS